MSQPYTSEVLWNVAQGISETDLNNAQRFLRTLLQDGVIASRAQVELSSTTVGMSTSHLRSFGAGSGAPQVSATSRQIKNRSGLIGQWVGSTGQATPGAGSPSLLLYQLATDELQQTLAVGDGTHPRIDRISVKLDVVSEDQQSLDIESYALGPIVSGVQTYLRTVSSQLVYTRRATRCQVQVTQGTPAASPSPPSTPAGYVPWCDVLVPQSHNAVFVALTHFRDWRLPELMRSSDQQAVTDMIPLTGWGTVSGQNRSSAAGGDSLLALCRAGSHPGRSRLLAVSRYTGLSAGGACHLARVDHSPNPATVTDLEDIGLSTGMSHQVSTWTGPLWDTGYPISIDSMLSADVDKYQLAARLVAGGGGDVARWLRFYTCGPA